MQLRPASMYDNVPPMASLSARRSVERSPGGRSLRPPSHVPSLQGIDNIDEISAERLNLYIDRNDGEARMLEQIEEEPNGGTFRAEPRTRKDRWKNNLRIVIPHIGLVLLSALYTVFGATVFHHLEQPFEIKIRNDTAHRVSALKRRIIAQLWTLAHDNRTLAPFDEWSEVAHTGMNMVIKDIFIDYTKNYMLPEDIITGTGPEKWSYGSSIFFSWTCITTIGYGHIVPRTDEGRVFCLAYALIGIPLILVTIADLGRFLSGGIIWVHGVFRQFRRVCYKRCFAFLKFLFCNLCLAWKKRKRHHAKNEDGVKRPKLNHFAVSNDKRPKRRFKDDVSEAGTFEDISEIHTHESDKTTSDDTKAQAEDLDEDYEPMPPEHRVSVLFILFIMLGYTSGGACLLQVWEKWSFLDAFYFCFVTVTTIGFGDIVPLNADFLPATLAYIVVGLIITTMCIDLVGSEYIRDIHFYGRSIGRRFMTIGGKVVHLGEVFSYVAFLQKNYGLTPDQLDKLAQLPEEYLLDCLINGRQPDLNWIGGRPYIPPDIFYFKWIEQPRTLSFTSSERVLASMDSLDLNTSRCSTARTMTPREYYHRFLLQYAKQMHPLPESVANANAANANAANAITAVDRENE
uniref:Ion_trans_2 domain-containing protein n=1 Tax=Panagrellus redivivus TaxID=6233 RepID=A0A7E4VQ02_PANRE